MTKATRVRIVFWCIWAWWLCPSCRHVLHYEPAPEVEYSLQQHGCSEGWNVWQKSDDKPSPEWAWCYRVRPAQNSGGSARPSV